MCHAPGLAEDRENTPKVAILGFEKENSRTREALGLSHSYPIG